MTPKPIKHERDKPIYKYGILIAYTCLCGDTMGARYQCSTERREAREKKRLREKNKP